MFDSKKSFYIDNDLDLQQLIAQIKDLKICAIDTEFTRQNTYYPILSTIQIAIEKGEKRQKFLIDCLAPNLDLSEFLQLICDEKIVKILHCGIQDLQIFYQLNNSFPQNIFDTQVMANFCGFAANIGYSNLVEKIFDVRVDKQEQRSDWQKRPLSENQIKYALLDVEFLHEIYQKFLLEINKNNRQKWLLEEMQVFLKKALLKSDESLLKNFALRAKSDLEISRLKKLVLWREELAKKHNVIRQYFLKDEDLEEIILNGFEAKKYRKLSREMQKEIIEILKEDLLDIDFYIPENRLNSKAEVKFLAAKNLIEKIAKKENFSAQFLMTNLEIKKIISDSKYFNEVVYGWKSELFSSELKKIIY
jgi:ribonuclease D